MFPSTLTSKNEKKNCHRGNDKDKGVTIFFTVSILFYACKWKYSKHLRIKTIRGIIYTLSILN